MDLAQIIDLVLKLNTSIDSYWNFYTIVVLATVGWLLTRTEKLKRRQALVIGLGLIVFFLANGSRLAAAFGSLEVAEDERVYVVDQQKRDGSWKHTQDFAKYLQQTSAASRHWYILHVVVDVLILILLAVHTNWFPKLDRLEDKG